MYTFETHNTDEGINPNMTCLQGYLEKKRHELVAVFGEPIVHGDVDDKVYCEWLIEVTDENGDTGVVTIYDWKNYSDAAMADDYRNWNVGGFTSTAHRVLLELIKQAELK